MPKIGASRTPNIHRTVTALAVVIFSSVIWWRETCLAGDAIPPDQKKAEAVQRAVDESNQPLEFYGKVVDQDGKPLSGVKVLVKVRHWVIDVPVPFGSKGKMIPIQRETGVDGRFEIKGVTGDAFDIESIVKGGYEFEMARRGYGPKEGSLVAPVLFRMWSANIHEKLVTGNHSFKIVPDGRIYGIDLLNGSLNETGSGNLKVWVKRPGSIARGEKYDWSCGVDVINGGLLSPTNKNDSPYLAPPAGYAPSFRFEQKVGSGWGKSSGDQKFYVKLNNGQVYGFMVIELQAYYNVGVPGMVRVAYTLNPSGSRILR